MPLRFVLLGPPASGKGTQGRRLAAAFGLEYLGTGALLREIVENGGPHAAEIRPILARGGYLPDGLMCALMGDWLEDHRGGWVLDGFPRSPAQAVFLDGWLHARHDRLHAAVALEVPKEELLRRIENRVECPDCRWTGQREDLDDRMRCPKCGGEAGPRADDDLENFLSRHEEYRRHTVPVIDDYAARNLLLRCDATGGIDQVAERLEHDIRQLISDGEAT